MKLTLGEQLFRIAERRPRKMDADCVYPLRCKAVPESEPIGSTLPGSP